MHARCPCATHRILLGLRMGRPEEHVLVPLDDDGGAAGAVAAQAHHAAPKGVTLHVAARHAHGHRPAAAHHAPEGVRGTLKARV